jgi:hypothetical protein
MPIPVTADPSYKRIPRSDLHPFQGELKELQRDEYDKLKASIEAEGFFEPVEIWTDEAGKHWIIDGHQRLFVCEKEGWELGDDIPTRPMPADDREHAARRLLALNSRFGRMTGQGLYEFMHSFEIDPSELDKFSLSDIDMDSFKLEFFEDNEVPPGDEDAVPEVPEDPTSRLGDLWLLGEHRVLCGDCTTPTDIQRVLNGCTVNLLHADPPYGMGKENDGGTKDALVMENDDLDELGLAELIEGAFSGAMIATRAGAYWYATVPARPLHLLFTADWKSRGVLRQVMVWVKSSMVLGHSEYHYKHEPILFGWVPGGDRHKNADRTRTTVWEYDKPSANREHPTMKPIPLFEQMITDGSRAGESVYDPYCRRENRAHLLRHRDCPAIRRCDRQALARLHRQRRHLRRRRAHV